METSADNKPHQTILASTVLDNVKKKKKHKVSRKYHNRGGQDYGQKYGKRVDWGNMQ